MARLRQRQQEQIVQKVLRRVSPAAGGSAPGPVTGVSSYNGRTGAVVSTLTDVPAHATTHQPGGSDAMAVDAVAATGSLRTLGSGAQQATSGTDARLSDARTPLAHTHPESDVVNLVADLAAKVPTARTLSVTAPLTGGGDLSVNRSFAISDFVASGASHARGTVPDPGVTPGTGKFLREDATWAPPTAPANGSVAEAYDRGTITLATDQYMLQDRHLYLTGSERLTATGTAEVLLTDMGNTAGNCLGTPKSPNISFTVMTDYFLDVIKRLNLVNQVRSTLQGTADLILTDDFQTRSRLVLAGMG